MNYTIFHFLNNLSNQSAFGDWLVTFCAVYLPYIVAVTAIIFIIYHRHKIYKQGDDTHSFRTHILELLILLFTVLVMWGIEALLKVLIGSPRPFILFTDVQPLFVPNGYAFPSGHATLFSAIAGAIFIFHRRVGLIFLGFAVLIGVARIISGVHFPIDILGGLIIGFFGVQIVYRLLISRD